MRIIKRNGAEVPYDCEKIRAAISAANDEVPEKLSDTAIGFIVGRVEQRCETLARPVHVEEVQDMVLDELDKAEAYKLARHYSEYRLRHEQQRRMNTTDGKILSLLERNNEEAKQENANKNPIINSTLRDYMAGEVSRDICRRFLFPEDVIAAHDDGIIHVHDLDYIVEKRVRREVKRGVQTIQYQINTLLTTNGQTPFVTVFMYLDEAPEGQTRDDLALIIEETLLQRIEGVKNEKGIWITPAFPKLIYVLDEDNIQPGSKYYYLTELAAKCTAKRMVPDYISAKVMKRLKGDVYACMGCRSFLTPSDDHKYYGRFNQGVVTINLVDVACSAGGDGDKFWQLLDERCELCRKALVCRHDRLKGTPSDVAPILWQYGALARLKNGEVIDDLLYNNYSTISLGYAGIAEMTYHMTGRSHTEPEGKAFALKVMRFLNDKCSKWRAESNISFSLYGTPMESVTYKFAQCLQRRHGIIPHVTDKSYITNSYHVHVTEPIDAFSKLIFEAEFQELSPGGAISYVEVPNLQNNIPAVLVLMRHIYETILYAELNTKSDYCQACGYDGEIGIVEEDGKLIWECPNCGNRDQRTLNVCRRTCGYLGTQFWNQGRTAEIKDRVMHL